MRETFDAVLFDLFGTLVDEQGQAIDGACGLLASLPADRWAIVTSCGRRFAQGLIRRAGLPEPQALVSADDVPATKPSPACYLAAASLLEKPAAGCLVVEDSASGIAAGKAAGMTVIAITRSDPKRLGADLAVESIGLLSFELKENGTIALR